METTVESTKVVEKPGGFFSLRNPLFKLLLIVVGLGLLVFLVIRLIARAPARAASGLFGGGRGKQNKIIRAEARKEAVRARAIAREDRQDRRDHRALIKAAKQERRACRKAAKGVRRRGGARRRARAACQQAYANTVAALRSGMIAAEAAEAAQDDDPSLE